VPGRDLGVRSPFRPRIPGAAEQQDRSPGWSCGGGVVGVLFSKSPRGRPAEMLGTGGGQSPKFQDRIWSAFCALRVRVGRVGWFAGRGNADLQSGLDSGKFEKLLRSDPRLIVGCGGAGCVCCLRTQ
jgi:hypothetical protein